MLPLGGHSRGGCSPVLTGTLLVRPRPAPEHLPSQGVPSAAPQLAGLFPYSSVLRKSEASASPGNANYKNTVWRAPCELLPISGVFPKLSFYSSLFCCAQTDLFIWFQR